MDVAPTIQSGGGASFEVVSIHATSLITLSLVSLFIIVLVSVLRVFYHLLGHRVRLFRDAPESAMVIVVGVILGAILFWGGLDPKQLEFNPELLLYILVPLIIMEAGYLMNKEIFFNYIGTILLYALMGTFCNAFITGGFLFGVRGSYSFSDFDFMDSMMFGSLISAVDPVAVLATFQQVPVKPSLNMLVFGESVLNDAVSIVFFNLFSSLKAILLEAPFESKFAGLALGKLLWVALLGCAVGFVMGVIASWFTKYTKELAVVEPLIVVSMALLSFFVAEVFLMSGIFSLLVCTMVMSRYVELNVHNKSSFTINYIMRMLGSTAETFTFLYLGVTLVVNEHRFDSAFVFLTLLIIVVSRSVVVVSLTALANLFYHKDLRISFREQFLLIYGGLRGSIAIALAYAIPEIVTSRDYIITNTLVIVMITIFVQGTTIKSVLGCLNLREKSNLLSDKKADLKEEKKELDTDINDIHDFLHMIDFLDFTLEAYPDRDEDPDRPTEFQELLNSTRITKAALINNATGMVEDFANKLADRGVYEDNDCVCEEWVHQRQKAVDSLLHRLTDRMKHWTIEQRQLVFRAAHKLVSELRLRIFENEAGSHEEDLVSQSTYADHTEGTTFLGQGVFDQPAPLSLTLSVANSLRRPSSVEFDQLPEAENAHGISDSHSTGHIDSMSQAGGQGRKRSRSITHSRNFSIVGLEEDEVTVKMEDQLRLMLGHVNILSANDDIAPWAADDDYLFHVLRTFQDKCIRFWISRIRDQVQSLHLDRAVLSLRHLLSELQHIKEINQAEIHDLANFSFVSKTFSTLAGSVMDSVKFLSSSRYGFSLSRIGKKLDHALQRICVRGLHYEEKQVVRALQEYDKLQAIEQQESRMVSQVPFLFTELDRDIAEGEMERVSYTTEYARRHGLPPPDFARNAETFGTPIVGSSSMTFPTISPALAGSVNMNRVEALSRTRGAPSGFLPSSGSGGTSPRVQGIQMTTKTPTVGDITSRLGSFPVARQPGAVPGSPQFGPSSPGVSPAHNPYGKTSKSAAPGLERMQTYSSGRFFSQLKKFDEDAGGESGAGVDEGSPLSRSKTMYAMGKSLGGFDSSPLGGTGKGSASSSSILGGLKTAPTASGSQPTSTTVSPSKAGLSLPAHKNVRAADLYRSMQEEELRAKRLEEPAQASSSSVTPSRKPTQEGGGDS